LRITALPDFLLQRVERGGGIPVNRQIYQTIREAILNQSLAVGAQLPSSRDLASALRMSRNTVTFAYEQLVAEGYLETRLGAGTFVTDTVPSQMLRPAPAVRAHVPDSGMPGLSARGRHLIGGAGAHSLQWGAFMPGVPDVTLLPNKIWSRLQNKYWRRPHAELMTYGHGGGYLPLREAICEHLRVVRSVNCEPDQVIVTSGIHQSIDLAAKLLGDAGDRAWVEEPCYWGTRSVLQSLDMKPVPIPVDADGISPQASDLRYPPRFIFVTPSHQYPLGSVMSLARRRMLLEYAASHHVWIVEDDYDSEFRYNGRPLESLQGLDSYDRVLYLGSFSKTLYPGLRVGFLVVPQTLATSFSTGLSELYRGGQLVTQAVLADFMNEGHFASHVRKMRVLYATRLALLQRAIADHFGTALAISGGDAGLHLTLALPDGCDDVAISTEALAEGIIARALSRYYMMPSSARQGLILGYACVRDEDISPLFARLARIIRRHCLL
jgi:GntR family transcriptional regulator/MocR family aminotransferase